MIQVYTIHKSSQLLSVWSISAHIQCVLWTCFLNTIIFYQINFVANFCLYIMIEGSSQQLLVISQFSQFFDVMAHISAERHLSKISFSYFYFPWHPQTFGMIKKIGVSPSFTLAVKSTVKWECVNYLYVQYIGCNCKPRPISFLVPTFRRIAYQYIIQIN